MSLNLTEVLAHFPSAKPSGDGYRARCLAHDDRNPSLSIREGESGKILLKCFAGCTFESICDSIAVDPRDLSPPDSLPRSVPGVGAVARRKGFPNQEVAVAAAMASAEKSLGQPCEEVGRYRYLVADGTEVMLVVRFDTVDGDRKTYRPLHPRSSSWWLGRPQGPLPLYRAPEFRNAKLVFVCEGEKAVDAAVSIGLPATTNAHGASSVAKTDWSPLAGRCVVLLPDNDEAGEAWSEDVAEVLRGLNATVRILALPDLPPKGDIVEFLEARRAAGKDDQAVRREVEILAERAELRPRPQQDAATQPEPRQAYLPFPLGALSVEIRDYVRAVASARCMDESSVAAVALVAMGAAIGLSRTVYDSYANWEEPALIWLALVAESGDRKSPVVADLTRPLDERQAELWRAHEGLLTAYDHELQQWTDAPKASRGPRPLAAPSPTHIYASDVTIEALIEMLKSSPRGILGLFDELGLFFGGLDRYSGNKAGAERAIWLSLHGGRALKQDRKSTGTTYLARAGASLLGGIQPDILRNYFTKDAVASGLAARFLLVMPVRRVKQYRQGPSPDLRRRYDDVISNLLALTIGSSSDDHRDEEPVQVPVAEDARELLREFVPDWSREGLHEISQVRAAMSKLEGYALRFALVLRCCREACGQAGPTDPVTRGDLENGIKLARWFKNEALRVYDVLAAEGEMGDPLLMRARAILEMGGATTARDWQKRNTRRSPDEAHAELQELVDSGLAEWRPRPTTARGGAPTTECAILPDGGARQVVGCGLRSAESSVGADETKQPRGSEGCGLRVAADGELATEVRHEREELGCGARDATRNLGPEIEIAQEQLPRAQPATQNPMPVGDGDQALTEADAAQLTADGPRRNPQPTTAEDASARASQPAAPKSTRSVRKGAETLLDLIERDLRAGEDAQ